MRKRWTFGAVFSAIVLIVGACISNPGDFTTTLLSGSTITLTTTGGTPTQTFLIGISQCDDDVDNDLDGLTDSGSDPECDSLSDGNERLDGVQSHALPTWILGIAADGVVTFDPTTVDFEQTEQCYNTGAAVWCLGITITGTGSVQNGTIDPEAGTLTVPFSAKVDLDALVGFPGLSSSCAIGPITSSLTASDYDDETGEATLEEIDVPVPAVSGCGSSGSINYDTLINGVLALPGQADLSFVSQTLDDNGDPVQATP